MANNSISLVSLDFDTLKSNLTTYLKNQPQFQDYNFDGSNMGVLLDILSYNSYLNAFYLNMVASEMFLDSAQLRNSVVSKAKELGYLPRSTKSAKVLLNCQFTQGGLTSFTIPAGASFTGKNAQGSYSFVTDSDTTLYPSGGFFTANNLTLYEGSYITDTFIFNSTVENQRFILTNANIDTDALTVVVSENNGANSTSFLRSTDIFSVQSNTAVYFLQATEDTKYEITFGDNVLGRAPLDNAIITASYRITDGSDGIGATNFKLDTNLASYNGNSQITSTIVTVAPSYAGANAETIESIRFNAPKHYQTQDRAVTANDFKYLILENYRDVKSVFVYGGETVSSSVDYGSVYLSPVSYSGAPLSQIEKNDIIAFIKQRCTISLDPKIIDPDFLYLLVTTNVVYDPNATAYVGADITSLVSDAIKMFNTTYLIDFDITFKMSRLEQAIDAADKSISSNQTKIKMAKDISPSLSSTSYIDVQLRNAVVPGSVTSSLFFINGLLYSYVDYNPNNDTFKINQNSKNVTFVNTNPVIYLKNLSTPGYETYVESGTIDYATGLIRLSPVAFSGFSTFASKVRFYAEPVAQDVMAKNNDIIEIDLASITISTEIV